MADGLCAGDARKDVNGKIVPERRVEDAVGLSEGAVSDAGCGLRSDSERLFDGLLRDVKSAAAGSAVVLVPVDGVVKQAPVQGFLKKVAVGAAAGTCALGDDDCRKKRCVDRYDSSESSDR